jgi:ribonuclease III
MQSEEIQRAEELLGYRFKDHQLLKCALTHASLADSRLQSNERLEFLGDAVLGIVVCEHLFTHYEDLLEGEMTKIKSTVVSRRVCARIALELRLDELLRLGKGMSNRAELPGSVVAAVYEALIGALYLDGGLDVARRFILDKLQPWIERAAASGHQSNFKSVLQQAAQQYLAMTPQYLVLDEQGPDHAKCFEVCVEVGARRFPSTWGASKKQAEQEAALLALEELGFATRGESGEILIHYGDAGEPPTGAPVRSYDPDAVG